MVVSNKAFDESLERVLSLVTDTDGGIYGPKSMAWRISRHSALFACGGRAALLQLSHPYIAHAVDQFSDTRNDPMGRFNRTFLHVYAMVFGDLESAIASARRVRRIHSAIHGPIREDIGVFARGHRFDANDADATLWVHATLIDGAILGYELFVGELTDEEKDRYWRETKLFAYLFGLDDDILPDSYEDFVAYLDAMYASDVLHVGGPAREIGRFLMQPPTRAAVPFVVAYTALTAGLLPPRLREEFGFRWDPVDRVAHRAAVRGGRLAYRALPKRLKYVPAYVEAKRRLAGKEGPDRIGRALEKLVMKGIGPRPDAPRASGCPVR